MDPNDTRSPPRYASPPLVQLNEKEPIRGTSLPTYNTVYVHTLPAEAQRPRRRNHFRRIARALHFLVTTALLFHFFPPLVEFSSRLCGGLSDRLSETYSPHLPQECTSVAGWKDVKDLPTYFKAEWEADHDQRRVAETSLELPIDSELLYFIGRGALSHGAIEIVDGATSNDKAEVTVNLIYHEDFILDVSKVCLLQPEKGHNGVGIFTPEWHRGHHHHRNRTFFAVRVKLPSGAGSRLTVNNFKTDLPIFVHHIGALADTVHFNSLSLHTSNALIVSQSIAAEVATISTSNGPITGNFTTNDSLVINTSNGPILANVTAFNNGSAMATKVSLRTTNSIITGNLTLLASTSDKTGGSFDVQVKSSNSPIDVTFSYAPLNHHLDFIGSTSNSPGKATLHGTYEGSFHLKTTRWFSTSVGRRDPDEQDPAGKGRQRVLELRKLGNGEAEGSVSWVPTDNSRPGSVELSTTKSALQLLV